MKEMSNKIKLKVPFRFHKVDKGCLLACLEMILNFYQKPFSVQKFSQKINSNKFGYDILHLACELKKEGFDVETGHFDKDIENDQYSAIAKTTKPELEKLRNFIKNDTPVIVHLSAKSLGAKKEEEIHAVVVIGFDTNGFFILNPPKIGEEYIFNQEFLNFWSQGGGYYLAIKKQES